MYEIASASPQKAVLRAHGNEVALPPQQGVVKGRDGESRGSVLETFVEREAPLV